MPLNIPEKGKVQWPPSPQCDLCKIMREESFKDNEHTMGGWGHPFYGRYEHLGPLKELMERSFFMFRGKNLCLVHYLAEIGQEIESLLKVNLEIDGVAPTSLADVLTMLCQMAHDKKE